MDRLWGHQNYWLVHLHWLQCNAQGGVLGQAAWILQLKARKTTVLYLEQESSLSKTRILEHILEEKNHDGKITSDVKDTVIMSQVKPMTR